MLTTRVAATIFGILFSLAGSSSAADSLLARCWPSGVAPTSDIERLPRRTALPLSRLPLLVDAEAKPIPAALRGSIRRVELPPGSPKLVALTFDLCETDGEVAGYDGPIIEVLRANAIRATLFVGGKWMTSHPERSEQLIADPLFEIANHGWAHRNARLLSGAALRAEIMLPQSAALEAAARLSARQCAFTHKGQIASPLRRPRLYRFPFGACNQESLDAVGEAGLLAVQWDISSGDATPATKGPQLAAYVASAVKPGSIVLFHANGRGYNTAEALPLLIKRLKSQGYRFVTVSELLSAGKPVISPTCYDHRPGDTERYDRLLSRPKAPKERAREPVVKIGL
ncbi:MAG: polysaccharide deacetylase family protein [Hyphomicrobiaceae bacterium]|nr:MAG: polysaccharide deacetylase family protein [Hyphomicrobiaceae bacterium]